MLILTVNRRQRHTNNDKHHLQHTPSLPYTINRHWLRLLIHTIRRTKAIDHLHFRYRTKWRRIFTRYWSMVPRRNFRSDLNQHMASRRAAINREPRKNLPDGKVLWVRSIKYGKFNLRTTFSQWNCSPVYCQQFRFNISLAYFTRNSY